MRESNFAFPAQNRACVCITSQLYDRRALDTTSPLPLFNSLTQLTYLTSTSPRIREIMTMDGGLERLVRILHDFCICPPLPENPALLYGLSPPSSRPPKLQPTLNPQSFDKHAAYRFSLAFQCLVNIGVRGSEPIRSRVVQAGTLDVVGCILEAWLANKGFAVGPSASATGMPRETREQRQARRLAQAEQRQREEAAQLHLALQRQVQHGQIAELQRVELSASEDSYVDDHPMELATGSFHRRADPSPAPRPGPSREPSYSNSDTDTSTDNSTNATPVGSTTPTGAVIISSRDRSGTIIARRVWDEPTHQTTIQTTPAPTNGLTTRARQPRDRQAQHHAQRASPTPSPDESRAETETEDDGEGDADGDVNMERLHRASANDRAGSTSVSVSPSPERRPPIPLTRPRGRTVGIVADDAPASHIIINDAVEVGVGVDGGVVTVGGEGGVEDGIVSLEQNDDFAMGAPPGAPGAIDEGTTPRRVDLDIGVGGTRLEERRHSGPHAPDVTPRAGLMNLPPVAPTDTRLPTTQRSQRRRTLAGETSPSPAPPPAAPPTEVNLNTGPRATNAVAAHRPPAVYNSREDSGPYRDEDVLLSLQLLAYLSKYPHVRQAFYKPRLTFHPASANLPGRGFPPGVQQVNVPDANPKHAIAGGLNLNNVKDGLSFLRSFGTRGKEKERVAFPTGSAGSSSAAFSLQGASSPSPSQGGASSSGSSYRPFGGSPTNAPTFKQTNVFSLVERFTFRPSASESDMPNPPPKLPQEIQYWAGVIMRNACRKDDSRGGIRQCANMLCGRWESYPREFAKCRRCRKAKYCGKECQSTAWSEGHRFWCSAKDGDEDATTEHAGHAGSSTTPHTAAPAPTPVTANSVTDTEPPAPHTSATDEHAGIAGVGAGITMTAGGTITGRTERRRVGHDESRVAGPSRTIRPSQQAQMDRDRREEMLSFAGLTVGSTSPRDTTGAASFTPNPMFFGASNPNPNPLNVNPLNVRGRADRMQVDRTWASPTPGGQDRQPHQQSPAVSPSGHHQSFLRAQLPDYMRNFTPNYVMRNSPTPETSRSDNEPAVLTRARNLTIRPSAHQISSSEPTVGPSRRRERSPGGRDQDMVLG
ncbi:hypothetical protein HGRIS_000748 [Hohenbuehelia grisea]|uniref:MYND-type domain-containing protein n=1 Tax=Hohenbuehelia grisea TaxID=104357 RepID=A0ABR3IPL2_9AGAR